MLALFLSDQTAPQGSHKPGWCFEVFLEVMPEEQCVLCPVREALAGTVAAARPAVPAGTSPHEFCSHTALEHCLV